MHHVVYHRGHIGSIIPLYNVYYAYGIITRHGVPTMVFRRSPDQTPRDGGPQDDHLTPQNHHFRYPQNAFP